MRRFRRDVPMLMFVVAAGCGGGDAAQSASVPRVAPKAAPAPESAAPAPAAAPESVSPVDVADIVRQFGAQPGAPEQSAADASPVRLADVAGAGATPVVAGPEDAELARGAEAYAAQRAEFDVLAAAWEESYRVWRDELDAGDRADSRGRFAAERGARPADPAKARAVQLREFIRAHPQAGSAATAMRELVGVFRTDRLFDEAVAAFDEVLDASPDSPALGEAAPDIAEMARKVGRWSDTVRRIVTMLGARPDCPNAPALRLAIADDLLAWDETVAARSVYRRIVLTYPGTRSAVLAGRRLHALELVPVGAVAPAFRVKDTDGADVSLAAYRGRYVVLVFWDSARPLRPDDLPRAVDMERRLGLAAKFDFATICVSLDANRAAADRFAASVVVPPAQVCDGLGLDGEIALRYFVSRTPSNVVIGPDGKIAGFDVWHTPQWQIIR